MSRIEVDPPAGATPAGRLSARRQFSPVRVWVLALMAGLIAGFASWLIGEAIHGRFGPPALVNISATVGWFPDGPEIDKLTHGQTGRPDVRGDPRLRIAGCGSWAWPSVWPAASPAGPPERP